MLSTNDITADSFFYGGKTAGKVNFNTCSSKDFLTNERFKTLRTNIMFCGADIKIIVLTSSRENEGKSVISAEIAKSMAEANKKALLIDADMRKSVLLNRNISSQNFYGLSEFLSAQTELENVLYNTQNNMFDVIFSGNFPPNPVELLSSDRFNKLIRDAREIYDYVIIDSPPLGSVIDSAVIATQCDGAIMVITPGKITVKEGFEVKTQLEKSGCRILGVVLNDVDGKNNSYYKKHYKNYKYGQSDK